MTAARGSIYSSTPFALSSQRSISASIQNTDIHKSHNAIVEMAKPTSFIVRIILMQLLSRQDLKGLYRCAAMLEMILLFQIARKLVGSYWISIMRIPTI